MTAYPHNVTISGKAPWPWTPRWVHVEDEKYLKISRQLSFRWDSFVAKDLSRNVIFTLKKQGLFSPTYNLQDENNTVASLRRAQLGHWVCELPDCVIEVYRLSGSKCVISKGGSQVAIMSVQSGIRLLNDHKVHIRVNEAPYLHLSIAVALLIDDFNLQLDTKLFRRQSEVSTLQPG
uniref:Uncharacterized protein n=1 Tax=Roseihalotalea indica TaxID=2867963 RepID=A0AA49JEF6_9BACT|nr:hypothetical protein K4G66_17515 [Tunicatimonas sp. TK19036]